MIEGSADSLIRDRDAAKLLGCSKATFWRRRHGRNYSQARQDRRYEPLATI